MGITFTIDDLIRYVYNETDDRENKQIKFSISKNSELKQEYNALKQTCKHLDKLMVSPCDEITNSIISYSRN